MLRFTPYVWRLPDNGFCAFLQIMQWKHLFYLGNPRRCSKRNRNFQLLLLWITTYIVCCVQIRVFPQTAKGISSCCPSPPLVPPPPPKKNTFHRGGRSMGANFNSTGDFRRPPGEQRRENGERTGPKRCRGKKRFFSIQTGCSMIFVCFNFKATSFISIFSKVVISCMTQCILHHHQLCETLCSYARKKIRRMGETKGERQREKAFEIWLQFVCKLFLSFFFLDLLPKKCL